MSAVGQAMANGVEEEVLDGERGWDLDAHNPYVLSSKYAIKSTMPGVHICAHIMFMLPSPSSPMSLQDLNVTSSCPRCVGYLGRWRPARFCTALFTCTPFHSSSHMQGVCYTYDDVIFHPGHIYFGAHEVYGMHVLHVLQFTIHALLRTTHARPQTHLQSYPPSMQHRWI